MHAWWSCGRIYLLPPPCNAGSGPPHRSAAFRLAEPGTGAWWFPSPQAGPACGYLPDYSCQSNFIVWLTDSVGSRVALLANKIGTSSVINTQKLNAGKYYLDVNAGGPWTIQAYLIITYSSYSLI